MKRPKTIDDILDGWIGDLERDGTITRWKLEQKREQNLKKKKRANRRLSRTINQGKKVTEIFEEMYPSPARGK
jgi:hypothetical protein